MSPLWTRGGRRTNVSVLMVLGAHLGLTLAYTWPMAAAFGTRVVGDRGDYGMFLWSFWWNQHAVFQLHQSPFFSNLLFAPAGASLAFHTHAFMPSVLSAPVQWVFGVVAASNTATLATFAVSGLAFFLLARDVTGDSGAAFAASVAFAYGHNRAWLSVWPNLAQTHFVILFLWALLRSRRRSSLGWAALAGLFAACVFYSCYNLFAFAAVLGVGFAVATCLRELRSRRGLGAPLREWAVLGCVLLVLISPLLVEIVQEISRNGYYASIENRPVSLRSLPVRRWFEYGPLAGSYAGYFHETFDASFMGYLTPLLALLGFVDAGRRRASQGWLVLALVGLVLMLGPHFNWSTPPNDTPTGLAGSPLLPFGWLQRVPVLGDIAEAHRWGVLGWTGLCMGVAFGVRRSLDLLGRAPVSRGIVCCACACGMFGEFVHWPFPMLVEPPTAPVRSAMQLMRADPRSVTVVEFPSGQGGDPVFPVLDMLHQKPVYRSGLLARTSPRNRQAALESEILKLLELASQERRWDPAWITPEAEIAAARIGWVVLSYHRWVACDPALFAKRASGIEDEMRALDAAVHAMFPGARVAYATAPPDRAAWFEWADCVDRPGQSSIYRVYRVESR